MTPVSTMSPMRFDSTAGIDEAELAAVAFLARYTGSTVMPTNTTCLASSNGPAGFTFV